MPSPLKSKTPPATGTISPIPQSPSLGKVARGLRSLQELAGKYQIDPRVPLLGGTSVDELFGLPGAAREVENWSYGNAPMRINPYAGRTASYVPEVKPGRKSDLADTLLLGADAASLGAPIARGAGRAALRELDRAMLEGTGPLAGVVPEAVRPMNVVKPKGGNWLAGSVERALEPLKRDATGRPLVEAQVYNYTPEMDAQSAAINRWLDTKLNKYIRNEMGTPDDPVKALAERGVLHFQPQGIRDQSPIMDKLRVTRQVEGFPAEGTATTPLGQQWERYSDYAIEPRKAGNIQLQAERAAFTVDRKSAQRAIEKNPWIAKLDPEAKVYGARWSSFDEEGLGFPHLIDELKNAMDPNSTLPRNLRIDPKDIDKITVPQAVERVAKINAWRAEEAARAEKAGMLENLKATPRMADDSLQLSFVDKPGGAWVDIPETVDEKGMKLCNSIGKAGGWCTQAEWAAKSYGSGENRLTALVDTEGRPHAQAKITENDWPVSGEGFTRLDPQTKAQYSQYVREWRQRNPNVEELTDADVIQALKEAGVQGPAPDITELKPVGNSFKSERAQEYAKRDPEYFRKIENSVLKFLNSGEWGNVADLHHYGIVDLQRDPVMLLSYLRDITKQDSRGAQALFNQAIDRNPNAPRFMTARQLREFVESAGGVPGFAGGGLVKGLGELVQKYVAKEAPQAAAEALRQAGIPGIRYLDQGSRGAGKGTSNFVVFPGEEGALKILDVYAKGGAVHMQDGGSPLDRFTGRAPKRGASSLPGYGEGIDDPTTQALLAIRRNLGEAGRAVVGAKPYDETNPTGSYRAVQALMNAPTPAAIIPEAAQAAGKAATALSGLGALGVVKPKGGNWVIGSVERGLRQMKQRFAGDTIDPSNLIPVPNRPPEYPGMMYRSEDGGGIIVNPEEVSRLRALGEINNWIDTKLGKYVRNELGTPEDPVRALAERGVLHFTPQGGSMSARANREMLGMPSGLWPTATSPLAQSWEDVADATIRGGPYREKLPMSVNEAQIDIPETLRQLGGEYAVQNPEALAYELNRGVPLSEGLGFRHLIDELRNATDPDSGLPRSLQLSPDKLQKVTVPQAVELVDKINKWRAEQKVAADLKRSQNAATVEYKAYDTIPGTTEPNQRGLRWVELRTPEITSADQLTPEAKAKYKWYLTTGVGEEAALRQAAKHDKSLAESLKYEGEVMGHCVGGYCPDVQEGRSRIYSLRDAKGEPHVTVEVKPARKPSQSEAGLQARSEGLRGQAFAERVADLMEGKDLPPNIVQIKGKANRAPKDEYLPFVQDFVRSGRWSSVGDMQNTGMRSARDVFSEGELNMLRQAGQDVPPALSGEDIQRLHNLITPEGRRLKYNARGQVIGSENPNYAAGGAVDLKRDTAVRQPRCNTGNSVSSSKTPRSLGDLLQRYNVDPRRYAEGGTVVDQYGRKLTRANYEGKVDRQGIPDDDDDPFNYNPNAQRYTNYKDELFLSPARNVLDESFRQKLSAQDPTGELKLIEKAYSAMPRDQFGDVFDQLNARDAWKVNQAAMGAHESPWVLNPENRMMAVGIADDVTGTPSVLLYDPTQRVGSFINPGFSTWTSSGDPETDFQQALNIVPYQQYAMMNKIGAWDRNYDEPLDPLKGAGPGMYSDADHEKIRKGLEDLSTPLPALDYQFLPRGYFNPTELSGSYAQKRANPEARAPFDLYKEFLNLNPVDNLLPKLPSLPSLSLKSKPGYAAGGAVNYNPSEIDTIVSEFREAFHG